jgi:hypothetical protein
MQELFHPSGVPRSQRSRFGAAVRDLEGLGADPDGIRRRFAKAQREWPDRTFGPEALVKHWDGLGPKRQVLAVAKNYGTKDDT